jgi:uncharacterized membrane protein
MTEPRPRPKSLFARIRRAVAVRRRLALAVLIGCLVYPVFAGALERTTRILIGWDSGALFYLVATGIMMIRADVHGLRRRAAMHDEGEWTIMLMAMTATLASLVAIGVELHLARVSQASIQLGRVGVAAVTIIVSWFFVHTIMAQHYAHDYYLGEGRHSGLVFPDEAPEPDYWDFLYVSFTIGAASQTSDVSISSGRIRRVVLAHTVLSFLFNTTILALGINVGASLL